MPTSKVLSVCLPAEMLMRVKTLARAEERPVSELIRETIRTSESIESGTVQLRRSSGKAVGANKSA